MNNNQPITSVASISYDAANKYCIGQMVQKILQLKRAW
jgi:hypothetical protein